MTLARFGAFIGGVLVGIVALPVFAVLARRWFKEGFVRWQDIAELVALLFGTAIASSPASPFGLDTEVWVWYLIGEALVFLPIASLVAVVFVRRTINER